MDRIQFREERRVSNERMSVSEERRRAENEAREQRIQAREERIRAEREAHEEQIRASDERIQVSEERIRAESDAFNEQMNAFRRENEILAESSSRPNISTPSQLSSPSSIPDQTQLPSVQSDSSVVQNNVASNGGNQEENPSPSFFEKIQTSIGFFWSNLFEYKARMGTFHLPVLAYLKPNLSKQ